ncbi:Kelch repeat-containing protein [Flagellimonas sp.]|uniref:Kelch repeat-containing protein n=1 Tax=Flagellimonas sp. TaxID=2058762 RepID=UPI003B52CD16
MKKPYLLFICTATFLFLNCKKDDGSLPVDDNPSEEVEYPETDIFDFSPALGGWGTKVTIRGENFDPLPEGNEVQFNGMAAQVESASETTLVAIVPEDATTGKIKLSANGYDYTSFQDFTVLLPPPIISDFEPKTGVEGDEVTITGDHFGDNPSAVDVLFHGAETPAEIKSFSDTEIVVGVPVGYKGPIQMGVGDQYTISSEEFTYLPWRQMKNFEGVGRRFAIAEVIQGKIYMGFGQGKNGSLGDLWEYDPKVDEWNAKKNFPGGARYGVFHFTLNGSLYIGAGDEEFMVDGPHDFYKFDPITNQWEKLDDFPGNPGQARQFASSFVIGGKAYIYGGSQDDINAPLHNDLWEYDPTQNIWTQKASFELIGRVGAVGFSIGNKGYISTGINNPLNHLDDIWEYNPTTNSWIEKKSLPATMERYGAISFTIGSKGYLGLGIGSQFNILTDLWEFDPIGNEGVGSWVRRTDFPSVERYWSFASVIDEKAYLGLGRDFDYNFPTDIWEYTPRHDE